MSHFLHICLAGLILVGCEIYPDPEWTFDNITKSRANIERLQSEVTVLQQQVKELNEKLEQLRAAGP